MVLWSVREIVDPTVAAAIGFGLAGVSIMLTSLFGFAALMQSAQAATKEDLRNLSDSLKSMGPSLVEVGDRINESTQVILDRLSELEQRGNTGNE